MPWEIKKTMNKKVNGKLKRNVEMLFEISAFRRIDRTWKQFFGQEVSNDAEHTFRVAWIALTLARYEEGVNYEKLLKMALLHDLAESRTGDATSLQKKYTKRKEFEAVRDIFSGTVHEKEMTELFEEYEKREIIEAMLVKDADHLDVDLELREMGVKGSPLEKMWSSYRKGEMRSHLHTRQARELQKAIMSANPHDWHLSSLYEQKKLCKRDKKTRAVGRKFNHD